MRRTRRSFGKNQNIHDFLLARIVRDDNDCWRWQAGLTTDGYPVVGTRRFETWRAHRLSYETFVGPIPAGLQIDHLCRVRSCINPFHLEAVTPQENTLRGGETMMFAIEAARTHCPQGHEYTEANTYRPKRGDRNCRTCKRLSEARRRERMRLAA